MYENIQANTYFFPECWIYGVSLNFGLNQSSKPGLKKNSDFTRIVSSQNGLSYRAVSAKKI
jgi:hypothetical protein